MKQLYWKQQFDKRLKMLRSNLYDVLHTLDQYELQDQIERQVAKSILKFVGSNRLVAAEKDVKFSHVQKDDIVEISNTQSRDKEYGIVEIVFDQEFRVLNFPYSAFNKNGEPVSKDCTGYITKLISNVSKGK